MINSFLNNDESKPINPHTYPILKKYKDHSMCIVLFTESSIGTCIYSNDQERWKLGEYNKGWNEYLFTPLSKEDKITLSNQ